ncbi:MAG: hypothetical protein Q8N99_06900 [Nanoarchaeota archaeon]|nr:hypothetical protein [Nanoarchaeota archaeon]
MKIEEHEQAYEEHLSHINKAIEEGLEENQRNAGYNVSQGAVELFAIYLHKLRLLQDSGDQLDHRIFKNKNLIEKRIPPDFPNKKKILELMRNIEMDRNIICYGKRKPLEKIEELIEIFQELRKIINFNLKNLKGGQKPEDGKK